jgi:hypothetical protein
LEDLFICPIAARESALGCKGELEDFRFWAKCTASSSQGMFFATQLLCITLSSSLLFREHGSVMLIYFYEEVVKKDWLAGF